MKLKLSAALEGLEGGQGTIRSPGGATTGGMRPREGGDRRDRGRRGVRRPNRVTSA